MRRIAPLLMCLVLVLGALCPAFCLQRVSAHSCCHKKAAGLRTNHCDESADQTGLAQIPATGVSSVPAYAVPVFSYRPEPSIAASFSLLPPSASVGHSPPVRFRVLRI